MSTLSFFVIQQHIRADSPLRFDSEWANAPNTIESGSDRILWKTPSSGTSAAVQQLFSALERTASRRNLRRRGTSAMRPGFQNSSGQLLAASCRISLHHRSCSAPPAASGGFKAEYNCRNLNRRLGAINDYRLVFTLEWRMSLRTTAYSSNRSPDSDHGLSLQGVSANERQRVFVDGHVSEQWFGGDARRARCWWATRGAPPLLLFTLQEFGCSQSRTASISSSTFGQRSSTTRLGLCRLLNPTLAKNSFGRLPLVIASRDSRR
jgi:hypothetical protein